MLCSFSFYFISNDTAANHFKDENTPSEMENDRLVSAKDVAVSHIKDEGKT